MADITMCLGTDSELCKSCYRKNANADPKWQSYFVTTPMINNKCDSYWKQAKEDKLTSQELLIEIIDMLGKKDWYTEHTEEDWIDVTSPYKMKCCDCGLVHILNLKVKSGKLLMNMQRVDDGNE